MRLRLWVLWLWKLLAVLAAYAHADAWHLSVLHSGAPKELRECKRHLNYKRASVRTYVKRVKPDKRNNGTPIHASPRHQSRLFKA